MSLSKHGPIQKGWGLMSFRLHSGREGCPAGRAGCLLMKNDDEKANRPQQLGLREQVGLVIPPWPSSEEEKKALSLNPCTWFPVQRVTV